MLSSNIPDVPSPQEPSISTDLSLALIPSHNELSLDIILPTAPSETLLLPPHLV